jgi:hypothetical protein
MPRVAIVRAQFARRNGQEVDPPSRVTSERERCPQPVHCLEPAASR